MATWADLQDALHRAQERTGMGPGGREVAEAIILVAELKAQAGRTAMMAAQGAAISAVLGVNAGSPGATLADPFGVYARRNTGDRSDGT